MQIRVSWPSDPLPNFEISVQKLYRANPLISGVKLGMTPWAVGLPVSVWVNQYQPIFILSYSHRGKVWQVTVEWISPCQSIDCFLLESETINLSASAHLFFWNKASAELFRPSTVLGRVWYKEAMPLPERKLFWWKPVPCRSLLLLPNGKANMMSTWHYRLEVLETTCANHPFTPHVSG